jgi:hypothetical protein
MSLVDEQIKAELEKFSGQYGPEAIVPAKVLSYNADDETIEVELTSGNVIDDVRLKSMVKAGNKLVIVPEDDSFVLIGKIANSEEYVVVSVDEVKEIKWKIGTVELNVDEDGVVMKKGADSLKEILTNIIQACQVIVVAQGNNPDYTKLATALTKTNNLLQ